MLGYGLGFNRELGFIIKHAAIRELAAIRPNILRIQSKKIYEHSQSFTH